MFEEVRKRRPDLGLELLLKHTGQASQVPLEVKNPLTSAGDARNMGSIPGSGRSPGAENGNPLQYSCLENSRGILDRGVLTGCSPWGHKRVGHDLVTKRQLSNRKVRDGDTMRGC